MQVNTRRRRRRKFKLKRKTVRRGQEAGRNGNMYRTCLAFSISGKTTNAATQSSTTACPGMLYVSGKLLVFASMA